MLPLAIVAIVSFVLGAAAGTPGSPEKDAAKRFTEAWANGEFAAMYKELNPASRHAISINDFVVAYREAEETATLRSLDPDSPGDPHSSDGTTVVPVTLTASTVAFGEFEADLDLPYADGGIAWDPSLVFPGLHSGEHLESEIELAPRAPILAADGTALAEGEADDREHPLGSAAIDVTGEVGTAEEEDLPALARQGFTAETPVGISGLEQAFNARLAGKPGGTLLAVPESGSGSRVIAKGKPKPGAPVKTTIDPDLQSTAVAALAGRSGGIVVLDARNGDVRALAGQAFSAPQPPGSTFKMITTTAALQTGVVSLDDEFEITNGATVGRFIENANGEYCGGTFRQAFAESCNADFAPLGPKIGNDKMVETAERFGFNSPPTLYAPPYVQGRGPAGIVDPDRNRRRSRPRRHRDRPGRSPGDSAGDGDRRPDDRQRRGPHADLDRRQQEAAPRRQAGAGDVEEDRRRTDRTDDRRRHRRDRLRGRDPPGPGRRQDREPRSSAPSPGRRTPNIPSRSRTPGSRPSRPPRRRSWRSGCC